MKIKNVNKHNMHYTFFPMLESLAEQKLSTQQKEACLIFICQLSNCYQCLDFDLDIQRNIEQKTIEILPYHKKGQSLCPAYNIYF